ncbi:hypothetical protein [Roseateles violae]|uniref:protein O-GlcNAc transferase n=1 Tax=Roseateles violae TaxID=3058042 RepID=A0ABT8DTR7_9BURK|nr:hypothetical protein [Pelomonas sp. PFR6]MDN3921592.1 hypothetical protein [Pelomonas sp. PFR6]
MSRVFDKQRVQRSSQAGERAARLRQWPVAAREYGQAVQEDPHSAVLQLHLARSFLNMGEAARALPAARRAVELQGDLLAYKFWVECLRQMGRYAEAAEVCAGLPAGIERDAEFCMLQAESYLLSEQPQQAVPMYMAALKFDIKNPHAHYQLGLAMRHLKMGAQAAICFETAVLTGQAAGNSSNITALALSMLVEQLGQVADWQRLAPFRARLLDELSQPDDQRLSDVAPFPLLAIASTPEQQLRVARLRAKALTRNQKPLPAPAARKPGARLRIGYLSADFFNHATVLLLTELLEQRDRERFEVFLYCHSVEDGSAQRRRMLAAADHVRHVGQISDLDAARLMREDGIDIAIDLKGFTRDTRMQILGYRPAPVQVGYLGFPGSSGADFLDYMIGDAIVTPLAHAPHFAEKIAQMPVCYQPNDRKRRLLPAPTRASQGLPEDAVVLCCFNQIYKIGAEMAERWAQILRASPETVLWLLSWSAEAQANLTRAMEALGVSASRLVFAPLVGTEDNVARLQCADLFLDTWPCNAHTTASEALWAGVPVLTVPGATFASRVAASLVAACGQAEFACANSQAYVDKAVALIHDRAALRAAQQHLREQRQQLPLFDSQRYTRDFEALLARIWARHEAGLAPDHLLAESVAP